MASYFLDSSALAKRYVVETGSRWVRQLTAPRSSNIVKVANLTLVEVISALYRRFRTNALSLAQVQKIERRFRREFRQYFRPVIVNSTLLDQASQLVARHSLRAYDAVQLATALKTQVARGGKKPLGFTFISADANLNNAALAEGLLVDDPNLHP